MAGYFAGGVCIVGAIMTGAALPVAACTNEGSELAGTCFRFEDFSSNSLELDAEQAKEALERNYPIGFEVEEVDKFMSTIGAKCDRYPKYPGKIYCCYRHTVWMTARFPPFPVLKEWIAAVT